MSLINREALREAITSKYCAECGSDQNCDKGYVADQNTAVICETKVALDAIDNAPTIDDEGEWIETIVQKPNWKGETHAFWQPITCSKCMLPNNSKTNFCPNCGKRMR